MNILLLGTGMQGRAALHDLAGSEGVTRVVAADRDVGALRACVANHGYGAKVTCEALDAADAASIGHLMAGGTMSSSICCRCPSSRPWRPQPSSAACIS